MTTLIGRGRLGPRRVEAERRQPLRRPARQSIPGDALRAARGARGPAMPSPAKTSRLVVRRTAAAASARTELVRAILLVALAINAILVVLPAISTFRPRSDDTGADAARSG